jgi:hypothetical protein
MAHGGCDRSAEDDYSSEAPDPTFAVVGGPCCPTIDLEIAFWMIITHCYYILYLKRNNSSVTIKFIGDFRKFVE